MLARDRESVRPGLKFKASAFGKQFTRKLRIRTVEQRRSSEISLPRGRQIPIHLKPDNQRIRHAPFARIEIEEFELYRKRVPMCVDEKIDTSCIGCDITTIVGGECCRMLFREPSHSQPARLTIDFDRSLPDNFGEFAGSISAERFHLPQSVLRRCVALKENARPQQMQL